MGGLADYGRLRRPHGWLRRPHGGFADPMGSSADLVGRSCPYSAPSFAMLSSHSSISLSSFVAFVILLGDSTAGIALTPDASVRG